MIDAAAPLEIFDEIDSTNVEARRRAEAGARHPVWLMARRQSAGRGRRGRAWTTIEGNLFATYLGPTQEPPAKVALRGFVAGVAIAEAAEALIGPTANGGRVTLKWPNDLMIDGAKAAGILLDSGEAHGVRWWALGFGINIVGAPSGLDQPAGALGSYLAAPPAPEDLLADIRVRLAAWDGRLITEGFAPIRAAWMSRAHGMGRQVRVEIGSDAISGVAAGLSVNGELEVDTGAGLRYISAGDIHFADSAA